jgi:hypothetical protein
VLVLVLVLVVLLLLLLLLLVLLLLRGVLEFRSALSRQRSRDSPVETAGVRGQVSLCCDKNILREVTRLELHSSQGTNGNSNKFNTVVL